MKVYIVEDGWDDLCVIEGQMRSIVKVFATKKAAWSYIERKVDKYIKRHKAEIKAFMDTHPTADRGLFPELKVVYDYEADSCSINYPYDTTYWFITEMKVED